MPYKIQHRDDGDRYDLVNDDGDKHGRQPHGGFPDPETARRWRDNPENREEIEAEAELFDHDAGKDEEEGYIAPNPEAGTDDQDAEPDPADAGTPAGSANV
jgi:hypothetical protein